MRAISLILLGGLTGFLIGCKGATSTSSPADKDSAAAKANDLIIGVWEEVDAKDGKNGKVTFTKEGGVILEDPGAPKEEGKYILRDEEDLECELPPPPGSKDPEKVKLKVKVGKEEMTLTDPKGDSHKFRKKS